MVATNGSFVERCFCLTAEVRDDFLPDDERNFEHLAGPCSPNLLGPISDHSIYFTVKGSLISMNAILDIRRHVMPKNLIFLMPIWESENGSCEIQRCGSVRKMCLANGL